MENILGYKYVNDEVKLICLIRAPNSNISSSTQYHMALVGAAACHRAVIVRHISAQKIILFIFLTNFNKSKFRKMSK